ncbi:glycoside hydrolase family 28 protein [Aaosphaeria arxii CBS 175.79]|uniref:Glycoside hydrolase family 28 protein n=1 Tax=Aaosphaeria arxii CBS 175.79 TaxID=1450172 RepID=A0A6A5YCV5_9PLEO|nr:glycoside hydrolase family 28 protein [Aaosphaeria arxii CBS 175.79]KAF2022434.1 glycoside hydrolase family 28 protein [Aaosphaeria arxii CBS 175.79]
MRFFQIIIACAFISSAQAAPSSGGRRTCVVPASGTNQTDDAPAILKAFKKCGKGGRVVFEDKTYYVNSALNITWLEDVEIDVYGTLLWSTDIQYWLNNSLPVGYQNQSTALVLGGNKVTLDGHGQGIFNGNGDFWYRWISQQENSSNYPGRPHAVTFNGLTNSIVRGLTFLRSQMWCVVKFDVRANMGTNFIRTMSIIYSHHVELSHILVNNTGNFVDSCNVRPCVTKNPPCRKGFYK